MKRSTLTILMLGLAAASTAQAEYRCDQQPLTRVDAIACAKASDLAELHRFIARTKLIYGLYIMDYGIPAENATVVRTAAQDHPVQDKPAQHKPEQVASTAQR